MGDFKQVIVLRSDLGMSTGKKIAQACHASLGAYKKASSSEQGTWEKQGMKKVVLKISGEESLVEVFQSAKDIGLSAYLVRDAGRTEVGSGTKTCVGIGPAQDEKVDRVTGQLDTM